jgi:hypothetical protein
MAFSRATFGPGPRTKGISDHIRKELDEVGKADDFEKSLEWTDVAILALDGLWRAVETERPNATADQIAEEVVALIRGKQSTNERRAWPNWREMSEDQAIEHDRSRP